MRDTDEMTQHTVKDRDRELTFEGELLGHASSYVQGKRNWAEMSIFRTTSNRYVVAGVGKTIVPEQSDRCWAHVCETAEGAVEALYLEDDRGIRYITQVARRALAEATQQDDELRLAFHHEVVT